MVPPPRRGKHVPGWCRPHRTGLPMDHPCNPAYYDRKGPKDKGESDHASEVIYRSKQEDQTEDSVAQIPEVRPPDEIPSDSLGAPNGRGIHSGLSQDLFSKLYYPSKEEPHVITATNACDKINAQLNRIQSGCLPPRTVRTSNGKPPDQDAELVERAEFLSAFLEDICEGRKSLSRAKRLDKNPVLNRANDKRHMEAWKVQRREFLAPLISIGGVLGDEALDELEDGDEDEEATGDIEGAATCSPEHVYHNAIDEEESDGSSMVFFSDVQDTVTDGLKKAFEKRKGKDKDKLDTSEWGVNDLVARQNQHKWMEALRDREIAGQPLAARRNQHNWMEVLRDRDIAKDPLAARQNQHKWMEALRDREISEPLAARQNQRKWMEALSGRNKLDASTWVVNDLVARTDDGVKHRGLKAYLKPLGASLGDSQSDASVAEKEASEHLHEGCSLRQHGGHVQPAGTNTCPMGVELRWAPSAWAAVIGGIIILGSMAGMLVCCLIGRRRPSRKFRGVHGFDTNLAESKEHPLPNTLGQGLETPDSLAVEPGVSDHLAPDEIMGQTTAKKVSFDVPESEEEGHGNGKPIVKDFEGGEPSLTTPP